MLIKKPNRLLVRRMIEDAVLSVDGVTEVSDTKLTIFNSTRKAQVSFQYKTTMGAYDMMETVRFDSDIEYPRIAGDTLVLPQDASRYWIDEGALVFGTLASTAYSETTLVIGGANG